MLKALRKRRLERNADFAADDWAPVPATASAAPKSWADWLAEEPPPTPRRASQATREMKSPTKTTGEHLGIRLIGHTDEHEVVQPAKPRRRSDPTQEYGAAPRPAAPTPKDAAPAPAYDKYLTPEERAIIDAQRTKPRARTSTAPGFAKAPPKRPGRRRPRTEELIQQFGEHMTPEELAILERQLG